MLGEKLAVRSTCASMTPRRLNSPRPAANRPSPASPPTARYVFYLKDGDLYRLDTQSEATLRITESGDATVVNVPAGGHHRLLRLPDRARRRTNPRGAEAQAGQQNLYRWDGGSVASSARSPKATSKGRRASASGWVWTRALRGRHGGLDPSRTTPDGSDVVLSSQEPA